MSKTESNHARWLKWIRAAVGILAIFGISGAFLEWRLSFLGEKISAVGERVEQISDPQAGYSQAVRQGIADALTQSVDKDKIVRAELVRAIGDTLAGALQENRDALDRMRTEIVAELRNQTGQLSGDIKRIGTDLNDVRFRQNILLQHVLGYVPEDATAFLKAQQGRGRSRIIYQSRSPTN